jgi:hypothetical protein
MSSASVERDELERDDPELELELAMQADELEAVYTYHWEATDEYGDMVTVHEWEPFAQLVGALGGRELAVAYVELGGKVASFGTFSRARSSSRRAER